MPPDDLWRFLLFGYLLTVTIETPVLVLFLSKRHALGRRFFAGLWLTACTYPVVVLVLPPLFAGAPRSLYLFVAETFAPAAECLLFRLAFGRETTRRDMLVVVFANLLSFLVGEVLGAYGWLGLFR